MQTMRITVQPLAPALGGEITGLDLALPLDAMTVAALQSAWLRYHVLVLRGADLSAEDQMRFCGIFGAIGARARPARCAALLVTRP